MSHRFLAILLALGFLAMLGCQKYTIKLDAPYRPGDEFDLVSRMTRTTHTIVKTNGNLVSDTEHVVEGVLEGRVTIEDVENGQPRLVRIVVHHMSGKDNGQPLNVPAAGRRIVVNAEPSGGVTVLIEGQGDSPDDKLNRLVEELVQLPKRGAGGAPSLSAFIAADGEKRTGDTWPVNAAAAPQWVGSGKFDASNVQGSSTLRESRKVLGEDCVRISTKAVFLPNEKTTDFQTIKSGRIVLRASVWTPIDTAAPLRKRKIEFEQAGDVEFSIKQPNQPVVDVQSSIKVESIRTFDPVD